jgi:hypothetical protein
MGAVALSVVLKAKPGKEQELSAFLVGAQGLVPRKTARFPGSPIASTPRPSAFSIASTMKRAGKLILSGPVAAALLSRAEELLAEHPDIRPVDILAEKLAG